MLINLKKIFSYVTNISDLENDEENYTWIELLALYNICEIQGIDRNDYKLKLKKVMDTIPASPETQRVFKAFY